MPYIGASSGSEFSFQTLKEKHSIKSSGVSGSSSTSSLQIKLTPFSMRPSESVDRSNISSATVTNGDYLESTETTEEISELEPPPMIDVKERSMSEESATSMSTTEIDYTELLELPNESTHVYSYNPVSPNSLAVRLNILKRSLEILIGNPAMLKDPTNGGLNHARNLSEAIAENVEFSKEVFEKKKPYNLQQPKQSTHSAALQAFVTKSATSSTLQSPLRSGTQLSKIPNLQRTSSLIFLPNEHNDKINEISISSLRRVSDSYMHNYIDSKINEKKSTLYNNMDESESTEIINTRTSDLGNLLDLLNETLENNASANASDLHMISLLNINKLNIGNEKSKGSQIVGQILLDSLAEPFFENQNLADDRIIDDEKELQNEMHEFIGQEDTSFSNLRPQQDYGRLLRTFTSMKNSAPHAIFTCSQQYPWQFKAANDLACLTFGISNNALRALTLLDLIHSDSRNFVLNKIMNTEGEDIVLTGEIVAIVQPGSNNSSNLIWASFWSKRKNDLLVCVFEKVPCDYMDVKLSLEDFSVDEIVSDGGLIKPNKYSDSNEGVLEMKSIPSISSVNRKVIDNASKEIKKKSVKFVNEIHDISTISHSLSKLINDVNEGIIFDKNDASFPMAIRVANHINKIRYFTLNHLSYNIPCAVSASILETEMKLKVHSLPYEAGLFIIDTHSLQLISFNKSVAKNMFGLHFSELAGKSINTIIPSFSDIVGFISKKYNTLDITSHKNKGIVLTEHFFRKIQAEMGGSREDFYTSVGIDATHRDGCSIKIDFQLRVVNSSIAFIWITHSRDVVFQDYTTTPSQLHMLKENELAFISSGSSSGTSSKKSSSKISLSSLKELSQLSIDERLAEHAANLMPKTSISSPELSLKPVRIEVNDASNTENSTDFDDVELQYRLELAKVYVKDKSQFVKEGNFKVDEGLIMSMASSPQSTKSTTSLATLAESHQIDPLSDLSSSNETPEATFMAKSQSEFRTSFLQIPEPVIGAQKRTKGISDFMILQKMGEGAYGKVNLCLHKKKKYIVVIKMIFKERILVDTWVRDRQLGTIPSEIQIMATLNKKPHDNILKLLDFFEDEEYYYIETPMHGETGCIDLFDLIEFKTNMVESEAKLIFMQIVSGIKHLHDQGIVHRDIKDENVIVDSKGFAKLIDFGSAAYVKSGPFDVFVGTIDYAAPEVLGGEPYIGKPQDIWAIGILLYTVIFKENPFYNIDEILEGELKFSKSTSASDDCIDLIKRILTRNPTKRPTIEGIYNDKWLQI